MKKVLLAIDGITPDRKAFRYAISLSRRIKAELSIFQVIRPQYYREHARKLRKKVSLARKFMEGSMVAATFAEAGEHDTACDIMAEASKEIKHLLQESGESGIHCHFPVASENPEKDIVDYVNNHRDVVLTIYDASGLDINDAANRSTKQNSLKKIRKDLSVPLVLVHN
jgi:nucleotide-binding universal stress UspA family protein